MTIALAAVFFFSSFFSPVNGTTTPGPNISIRQFDEFGDVKCEDEYARLDNFVIALQNEPKAKGIIVFYGGRTFRGELPRHGEAEARAARLKPYLVKRRGIPSSRIIVVNGGYRDEWKAELWIRSPAAGNFLPVDKTAAKQQIKFRTGKVNPRNYRCEI